MNKADLKIGQELFAKPIGNAARRGNTTLKIFKVKKLGSKYFIVENELGQEHRQKFSYETMQEVSEYTSEYLLYTSLQQVSEEIERPKIVKSLIDKIHSMKLKQLKELNEILTVD